MTQQEELKLLKKSISEQKTHPALLHLMGLRVRKIESQKRVAELKKNQRPAINGAHGWIAYLRPYMKRPEEDQALIREIRIEENVVDGARRLQVFFHR